MTLKDYKQLRMQIFCDVQSKKACLDPRSCEINKHNEQVKPFYTANTAEGKELEALESVYYELCKYIRICDENERRKKVCSKQESLSG